MSKSCENCKSNKCCKCCQKETERQELYQLLSMILKATPEEIKAGIAYMKVLKDENG